MAYDIFDTYKRRLNESASSRFNDVSTQESSTAPCMSREEIFDKAFRNVYGIHSSPSKMNEGLFDSNKKKHIVESMSNLTEDFGTFPSWLKTFFERRKDVRKTLTNKGVDLANATFISGQLPRNARDPAFKDETRVAVFRMVDRPNGSYEVIYIPGITDPDVYPDENNRWSRYSASTISKKKLLELTLEYGYIDMNDSRNSNMALRKQRADAKQGMVIRDRAAGQSPKLTNVKYGTDENGRTNYDTVVSYDIKWVTKRGYDKSGYPLDPDKYGRMLDRAGLDDYSVRLEMLYNKIEATRANLIDAMNKYTARDSMGRRGDRTWQGNSFGSIASATQDFSRAIDAYREVESRVQEIVDDTELDDDRKSRRIQHAFSWYGKSVRDYLNEVNNVLKSI